MEPELPTGCRGKSCSVPDLPSLCPVGCGDPGSLNGKGIYADIGGNYCALDLAGLKLCPESFANRPLGVTILYRSSDENAAPLPAADVVYEKRVGARVAPATSPQDEQEVKLTSLRSLEGRLLVSYETLDGDIVRDASMDTLASLTLWFDTEEWVPTGSPEAGQLEPPPWPGPLVEGLLSVMELTLRQGAPGNSGLATYDLSYRATAPSGCAAYFVDQRRVDALSAEVIDDPSATTMACRSGAIATCMEWGYTPWNGATKDLMASEYLFATCLQAKRAAYFIGFRDTTSYTKNGTPIVRRDPFGINGDRVRRVEALWSPRGAECLNRENLRRRDIQITDFHSVPACTPTQWTPTAKIATGPAGTPVP